jgi:RNA polymerase sigma-70 factor (ECF subfamily)
VSIADARPVERDEAQMIAAILAGDRELYHRLIQPYELSIEETAGVLAISISSVKVRLHRARIMLQKELAPKLKLASPKERRWLSWY